ncbi:MAG: hypothetical protein QG608_802 [Actinomycetota bacterium]|nr:hypothetical protein [Actinomycetota bacterium]
MIPRMRPRRYLRLTLPALVAIPALTWVLVVRNSDDALALNPEGTSATTVATTKNTLSGQDISWPQCTTKTSKGLPMPTSDRKFVVVGLTNGRAFTTNPCLSAELAWLRSHHALGAAYAMANYPTASHLKSYGSSGPWKGTTLDAKLRNVGWAEAEAAVNLLRARGFASPTVWIDVEGSKPQPWSTSTQNNAYVLSGFINGLRNRGHKVGIYSTVTAWKKIVGTGHFSVPEWRTVGMNKTEKDLLTACTASRSIQGGTPAIIQRGSATVDHNRTCPATTTPKMIAQFFHQY